jgi:hypothetical protein
MPMAMGSFPTSKWVMIFVSGDLWALNDVCCWEFVSAEKLIFVAGILWALSNFFSCEEFVKI